MFEMIKEGSFVKVGGRKMFVIDSGNYGNATLTFEKIDGVSKGRPLHKDNTSVSINYYPSEIHGIDWFRVIDSTAKVLLFKVEYEYKMSDGSDPWTEIVKTCREGRKNGLSSFEVSKIVSDRMVRKAVSVKFLRYEPSEYYYHVMECRYPEKVSEVNAMLPEKYLSHIESLRIQDQAMSAACEREGSARFTYGT